MSGLPRSAATALTVAVGFALAACTIERRTDRVTQEEPRPSTSEFLRPFGEAAPPAGVKSGTTVLQGAFG